MKNRYSTFEIEKILGIKYERFKVWVMSGYVMPSIQCADGPVTRNIFSRKDLYRIFLFKELLDAGLNRKKAAKYVDCLDWGTENRHVQKAICFTDNIKNTTCFNPVITLKVDMGKIRHKVEELIKRNDI